MKTFVLSLVFIVSFPSVVNAFSFRANNHSQDAEDARLIREAGSECPKSLNQDHILISFDGLMNIGRHNQNLAVPSAMRAGARGVFYNSGDSKKATACMKLWKKRKPHLKFSLMGHSCGGVEAMKSAEMVGSDIQIENMITVDPVCGASALSGCADQKPAAMYQSPTNVSNHLNFFQCAQGLTGEAVAGANNCEIVEYGHVKIPQHPRVQEYSKILLSGGTPPRCDGKANSLAGPTYNPLVRHASYNRGNSFQNHFFRGPSSVLIEH